MYLENRILLGNKEKWTTDKHNDKHKPQNYYEDQKLHPVRFTWNYKREKYLWWQNADHYMLEAKVGNMKLMAKSLGDFLGWWYCSSLW